MTCMIRVVGALASSAAWLPWFLILSALVVTPSAVFADSIRLEAENFEESRDVGGNPIAIVTCSGASGGLGVDAMDTPAEWVSWNVPILDPICFVDSLRSAGNLKDVRLYNLQVLRVGEDEPLFQDLLETPPGLGIS